MHHSFCIFKRSCCLLHSNIHIFSCLLILTVNVHVSGETVFLAAVYGPVEVKLQKIQIDRATVEATFRSSSGATCELHVVISSVYVVSTQTF